MRDPQHILRTYHASVGSAAPQARGTRKRAFSLGTPSPQTRNGGDGLLGDVEANRGKVLSKVCGAATLSARGKVTTVVKE